MANAVLPYLNSPGSLSTVLDKITKAATPDRVTGDVITNTYLMKGGYGRAVLSYLKRINFIGSDGVPTELYKQFRNENTAGQAVAQAILHGYAPLKALNERFYELSDSELKSLIIQITGAASDSSSVNQTLGTLKKILSYADFRSPAQNVNTPIEHQEQPTPSRSPETRPPVAIRHQPIVGAQPLLHYQFEPPRHG
jgi:hypothetical protein